MLLKKTIVLALAATLCVLAFSACAPSDDLATTNGSEGTAEANTSAPAKDDPYISDEACLQCHGGTYEALAQETEAYGDSNPHDSVHGGYLTCDNCHAKGSEIPEEHLCMDCHDWPREEQSVLS